MNTLLTWWVQLADAFGTVGAAFILIYAGLLTLLVASIAMATVQRWSRRRCLARELRVIRQDAYRELERIGGRMHSREERA